MPQAKFYDHLILMAGVIVMLGPVVFLFWLLVAQVGWTDLPALFSDLWTQGAGRANAPARTLMINSLVVAFGLAILKTTVALLASYALIFFRLRFAGVIYGAVLVTLFFPIESRIIPTFLVTSQLGLLNTYAGMILPVAATGLGLLVFRQFMLQLPVEVIEAARIDGAGPIRVLVDFIIPLSTPMIAALFAILFVLGWQQYVWPIMITTTSLEHGTLVGGMANAGFAGRAGIALAILALIPPAIVVLILQRWLMRGLTTGIH